MFEPVDASRREERAQRVAAMSMKLVMGGRYNGVRGCLSQLAGTEESEGDMPYFRSKVRTRTACLFSSLQQDTMRQGIRGRQNAPREELSSQSDHIARASRRHGGSIFPPTKLHNSLHINRSMLHRVRNFLGAMYTSQAPYQPTLALGCVTRARRTL